MPFGPNSRPSGSATDGPDRIAIIRLVLKCWAQREIEPALACMTDDIAHVVNIDGETTPIGATSIGKQQMREKLHLILDTFDFDAYVVDYLKETDDGARAGLLVYYRHKASGGTLNVRYRLAFTLINGLIGVIEEFHDAAYVEAFMRLAETGVAPPA